MKRSVEMMGISHEKKVGKSPVCLGAESGGKRSEASYLLSDGIGLAGCGEWVFHGPLDFFPSFSVESGSHLPLPALISPPHPLPALITYN